MDSPADFKVDGDRIALTGDWSAICLGDAKPRLIDALRGAPAQVELGEVGRFDTAGALALIEAAGGDLGTLTFNGRPETLRLIHRVDEALHTETPTAQRRASINAMMERMGRGLVNAGRDGVSSMGFFGHLLVTVGNAIIHPRRVRWATVANVIERAGIDAIPIVLIANFFIGAVIAFLAASMLADLGVQIFAVETVGFGVLREFCVVITAVLIAGRSASSFAAEIGSMKMQQEIDAMQIMGVEPFEAIVLPRFIALFLFIFVLTFLGALAGLFGGALVLWSIMDLSPVYFVQRIQEAVGVEQFYLALYKAPVMAVAVATIGCRQGLLVEGDIESLGKHVTTAVVQSVFSIIVLDAIFALIFLQLDL